jgi:carbonic anhydrase/acetyltransferase-like protein (isoleucine patch superfamily)
MKRIVENKKDTVFPTNKYHPYAWIRGNPDIGKDVWIGPFTIIDANYANLIIGKGCNIAAGAKLMTHSTIRRCLSEGELGQGDDVDAEQTIIGEYCFVGTNAVILMGVTIGHHSVIGAGCVVPEGMNIPPYSLVVGVPGKVIGSSKKLLNKYNKVKKSNSKDLH